MDLTGEQLQSLIQSFDPDLEILDFYPYGPKEDEPLESRFSWWDHYDFNDSVRKTAKYNGSSASLTMVLVEQNTDTYQVYLRADWDY